MGKLPQTHIVRVAVVASSAKDAEDKVAALFEKPEGWVIEGAEPRPWIVWSCPDCSGGPATHWEGTHPARCGNVDIGDAPHVDMAG